MTGERPSATTNGNQQRKLTPEEFAFLKKIGKLPGATVPQQPTHSAPVYQSPRSVFESKPQASSKPEVSPDSIAAALQILTHGQGFNPNIVNQQLQNQSSEQGNNTARADKDPSNRRKFKLSKKALRVVIGGSLAASLAAGGFAAVQTGFIGDLLDQDDKETSGVMQSDLGNGVNIQEIEPLGLSSLKDTQCHLPGATLMIMTVEGKAPLIPLLPGTSQDPYMSREYQEAAGASPEAIEKIAPFFTGDYNYATLNDMPLYVNPCLIDSKAIEQKSDGSYTIDRSGISMEVRAPNELFGRHDLMWTVPQDTKPEVETDPERGQYMTIPLSMYVDSTSGDKKYNSAAEALNNSVKDPLQLALILAAMQTDIVQQVDNVVDGHEGITYPEGVSEFEKAQDFALLARLGIPADANIVWSGNYNVKPIVAYDGGKPITSKHSLVGLKVGDFKIEDVTIEYGTPTDPDPPAPPTSTPEPTQEAITD